MAFYWRYIKPQCCVEVRAIWRFCYEVAPGVYANVKVCWN